MKILINSKIDLNKKLLSRLRNFGNANNFQIGMLYIVIGEIVSNVYRYGYMKDEGQIEIEIEKNANEVTGKIRDNSPIKCNKLNRKYLIYWKLRKKIEKLLGLKSYYCHNGLNIIQAICKCIKYYSKENENGKNLNIVEFELKQDAIKPILPMNYIHNAGAQ